jgi:hypothetical protein
VVLRICIDFKTGGVAVALQTHYDCSGCHNADLTALVSPRMSYSLDRYVRVIFALTTGVPRVLSEVLVP